MADSIYYLDIDACKSKPLDTFLPLKYTPLIEGFLGKEKFITMQRTRLLPEERKKEIRKAAARKFLEKGFSATTMEDVIAESGLSVGGVYHYYKNTGDILYDIMEEANKSRIEKTLHRHQQGNYSTPEDMAAQFITEKIIDENPYKPLYAMFLLEKHRDPKLQRLFEKLSIDGFQEMLDAFGKTQNACGIKLLDSFLFTFMNALTIGFEYLDEKELFKAKKQALTEMVKAYLVYKNNEE